MPSLIKRRGDGSDVDLIEPEESCRGRETEYRHLIPADGCPHVPRQAEPRAKQGKEHLIPRRAEVDGHKGQITWVKDQFQRPGHSVGDPKKLRQRDLLASEVIGEKNARTGARNHDRRRRRDAAEPCQRNRGRAQRRVFVDVEVDLPAVIEDTEQPGRASVALTVGDFESRAAKPGRQRPCGSLRIAGGPIKDERRSDRVRRKPWL